MGTTSNRTQYPPEEPPQTMLEELAAEIRDANAVLVVTGAGVSLASGIPTFRGQDPGAVWHDDVTELGTLAYFRANPVGSWSWYLKRFEALRSAQPNDAHLALADLERWCDASGKDFLLVTQNVDTLHQVGGSRNLVEVHGSHTFVRCSSATCTSGGKRGLLRRSFIDVAPFLANPDSSTLPRCPQCGAVLRQHVLWFDERYDSHVSYRITDVLRASKRSGVILFCGTSFAVGVTEAILANALRKNRHLFSIDPSARSPHRRMTCIAARAESALPRLLELLGAQP